MFMASRQICKKKCICLLFNKTYISNSVCATRFLMNLHQVRFFMNLHQVRSDSKDWKVKLFKSLGCKKDIKKTKNKKQKRGWPETASSYLCLRFFLIIYL